MRYSIKISICNTSHFSADVVCERITHILLQNEFIRNIYKYYVNQLECIYLQRKKKTTDYKNSHLHIIH